MPAKRLFGGKESTAYRIGPMWRRSAEIEWCHAIARHTAATLPDTAPRFPPPTVRP
ncbi:hypothetical protein [Spongiactinospora gelatinilytica]|uniref:hypothetical protein n=1 Tax=Spongiactinospora gelatinilytica TaxID=2666298 RepID=UPI001314B2FF|nr:hypothetical protein [Spongiactinospora gelatinilytica]